METRLPDPGGPGTLPLFVYGTLLDEDVRCIVLGPRAADALDPRPARLHGFRRHVVRGRTYPLLVPARGFHVDGALLEGLDYDAAARLAYFEAAEYDARRVRARCEVSGHLVPAWSFVPRRSADVESRIWELERWRRRYKRPFLRVARFWMSCYAATGPGLASYHTRRSGRPHARRVVRDNLG